MKIGFSQVRRRSPVWLGRTRNALALFHPATITFIKANSLIKSAAVITLLDTSLDYILTTVVVFCIFTGREINSEEEEKSEEDGNS